MKPESSSPLKVGDLPRLRIVAASKALPLAYPKLKDEGGFTLVVFAVDLGHDHPQVRRFDTPCPKIEEKLGFLLGHNPCLLDIFCG